MKYVVYLLSTFFDFTGNFDSFIINFLILLATFQMQKNMALKYPSAIKLKGVFC